MVELISYFGNDLMIVNAARVSFGKNKAEFDAKDKKLLKYLKEHRHISVFRHPQLQFRITCPIFVERQLFKHQVGLCLSGDTLISFINSSKGIEKISINDLYQLWTNGRSHQKTPKDAEYSKKRIKNKKLRVLNEETGIFEIGHIADVFYSGKKDIYQITLENGYNIKCSKDHRIYTDIGFKTINNGLRIGSNVACNGIKVVGNGKYRDKQFMQSLRNQKKSVKEMAEFKTRVHYSKIKEIKYIGQEDTYDIEVDYKFKNFVANNIVVHNSANSISGRYVDFSDSYFSFKDGEWREQSKDSKQGSAGAVSEAIQKECSIIQDNIIEACKNGYNQLLSLGVSKEQARIVLPLCLNTTFIWTGSLLAFLHLWELRLKNDAQKETRDIAYQMLQLVKNIENKPFEHTLTVWGY